MTEPPSHPEQSRILPPQVVTTIKDGRYQVLAEQRDRIEDAARRSEAFNRSIVQSSPDCIKILDLEGNLLVILSGAEQLGIENTRPFLNKPWVDFWHGKDRLAAQAAVQAAAAGGKGEFIGFFRSLHGEPKWWNVRISPILDANGAPERLLAVSRDVSAQRRREMNLEFLASVSEDLVRWTNMREMLQSIGTKVAAHLELSVCAFVEVDESAEQVVINHAWHRADVPGLAGTYRLADFVGDEFIRAARTGEAIIVDDTALDPRTGPEKFAALQIASFICMPLIRDAQWRFALCLYHSVPHNWREDEIALTRELTERIWMRFERLRAEDAQKNTENALRESEALYRGLFNSMDEGFCIIEMIFDGDNSPVDYLFLEVNPIFEQQCGLIDAPGKRMRELLPEHEAFWFEMFGKVALTGEAVRVQVEGKAMQRWFDIQAFRIGGPGSLKVAVIFNNITDRRNVEHTLQVQAQALADLDRRKDEFLAMLSHELRNPLAPISNAVHMLRLQKNEDPVQRQARTIIERQVGQLTHLVDELLEISRISTGRVQLRLERISVGGVVDRAIETAQPLITQRLHALTVSLPPQPIWLQADAARLEQVLVNLLTNAAKYTNEGGHIWLTVRQEGDAAVLLVRDTGIGIAAELLPRIFDLFTQAERSLDRSQGGLGIGLCLVQRLVDLHGGTTEVQSVLGQGSEFVVRLPAVQSPVASSPLLSSPPTQPPGKLCRVLVVDDNVDAADSFALLLTAQGHDVRVAYDGPTALQGAHDFPPDLVLLDIGLPGLNGYEVAKRMRQQNGLETVVLVAMTGYGQETDRQHSKDAGFDHHLVKPADFATVRKILATVSGSPST